MTPAPAYRAPPPEPPAAATDRPGSPQGAGNEFTGVVRDLQQRDEQGGEGGAITVWSFRIERHDANGDQMPPVPVEMRGYSFSGAVSNGDEIRARGRWRDGTLRVDEIDNRTTSAQVRAKDYRRLRLVLLVAFSIFFAVIAVVLVSGVITTCTAPWPPEP